MVSQESKYVLKKVYCQHINLLKNPSDFSVHYCTLNIFESKNFFKYFSKFETRMGNFWCSHKKRWEQVLSTLLLITLVKLLKCGKHFIKISRNLTFKSNFKLPD
jgi:hypothetical protein